MIAFRRVVWIVLLSLVLVRSAKCASFNLGNVSIWFVDDEFKEVSGRYVVFEASGVSHSDVQSAFPEFEFVQRWKKFKSKESKIYFLYLFRNTTNSMWLLACFEKGNTFANVRKAVSEIGVLPRSSSFPSLMAFVDPTNNLMAIVDPTIPSNGSGMFCAARALFNLHHWIRIWM